MSKNLIYLFMLVLLSSVAFAGIAKVDYYETGENAFGTNQNKSMVFTASANYDISNISLKLYRFGVNTGEIGVALKSTVAGVPDTTLCYKSYPDATIVSSVSPGTWLNFTMSSSNCPTLVSGTKYAISLYFLGASTIQWRQNNAGGYAGGSAFYLSGGIWTQEAAKDYYFRVYNSSNSIEFISPEANDIFNADINFTYRYAGFVADKCKLFDNRTGSYALRAETLVPVAGIENSFENTNFPIVNGKYVYNISCFNNAINRTGAGIVFYIDTINPIVTFGNISIYNTTKTSKNITLNVSVSDQHNYLTDVNVTHESGFSVYSRTYNTTGTYIYNISSKVNMTQKGYYSIRIDAADGHTTEEIEDIDYDVNGNEIDFGDFAISSNRSIFDVSAEKNIDRYNINFVRGVGAFMPVPYEVFFIESPFDLDIIEGSEYKGHVIVKKGNMEDWYWVDFETLQNYNVVLSFYNDTTIVANIYGMNGDYNFSSVGRVNVQTKIVQIYYDTSNVSLSETYDGTVINRFNTDYLLNATFNPVFYDYSTSIMKAYLQYEGVNFTAEVVNTSFNNTVWNYTKFITESSLPKDVEHKWHFSIVDLSGDNKTFKTANQNQTVLNVSVGNCAGSIIYPIFRMFYHDEIDDAAITASNSYFITLNDGTYNYNASGFFSGANNNQICVNINPATFVYNWELGGTISLSKVGYISRIYTFSGNEILVSNNPATDMNFYLISVLNSSTITYTWRTNQYQLLDGTMEISKCNANGTKSIVESIPIVGGNAVANINLLTSAYSYVVYIDGTRYEGDGFTPCHVESSSTASYFVDLNPIDIMPVIGLHYVNCAMTKVNASVARMTWESNEFSSAPIEGCLKVYRSMVTGLREVYEYCSIAGAYSIERSIPNDGFEYQVRGQLTQGSNAAFCSESLEFYPDTEVSDEFGITGLLGLVFALIAMVLLFAEQGELQLIGMAVGLVGFWMLGVVSLGWAVVMTALSFLVIIFMVGRYSRKN